MFSWVTQGLIFLTGVTRTRINIFIQLLIEKKNTEWTLLLGPMLGFEDLEMNGTLV